MSPRSSFLRFVVLPFLFCPWAFGQKGGIDDLLDAKPAAKKQEATKVSPEVDGLLEGKQRGMPVRLVAINDPTKPLVQRLFWHSYLGAVAGEAVPAEVRVGDEALLASQLDDEDFAGPLAELKPTVGSLKLAVGKEALLSPGKIPLRMQASGLVMNHPALKLGTGNELQILCAPVRFESFDEQGRPAPATLTAWCDRTSLLRRATKVTRLTLWLPVGLSYTTSFGNFSLAADGKINVAASGIPSDVKFHDGVFRRTATASPVIAEAPREVLSIKANKTYRLFVSRFVRPNEPLWLAVSRKEYAEATNEPPDRSHLRLTVRSKIVATAEATTTPPNHIRERLAAEFGALDGLAMFQLAVADQQLGGNTVTLSLKHGEAQTHHFLVSEPDNGLTLVAHRHRTVFAEHERPVFQVLAPRGCAGGAAEIQVASNIAGVATSPESWQTLGQIVLPEVKDAPFDSRAFELNCQSLPIGGYRLRVTMPGRSSQSLPLAIVPWRQRGSFHSHSMVWGGTWPESDDGLAAVHEAGIETLIQGQQLRFEMPSIHRYWQSSLSAAKQPPAELALERTHNDIVLERLLRHQIKHVDFAVTRIAEFYNEGLAYHHSYAPSVERVLRRLQIFTQQTADYPSAAGVNYSWFPRLEGYVEAGVPWDAHVAERNRVLEENVFAAYEVKRLTKEERDFYLKNRDSTDPAVQQRVADLLRQATRYWKGHHEQGFARHNRLYNDAIRAIRPDAINTLYENAGHDSWKRPADMFHDMAAACYFTMTDYGDWPMSAGFTTEWGKAQAGEQPLWITSEGLNSVDGQAKNLFHAFARGLDGGGMPMPAGKPRGELLRRGQVTNFLAQYGSIAKHSRPDRRLSILATAARQMYAFNGSFAYHAATYHLTRLGVPPGIVTEETVQRQGVPDDVGVLALVNVDDPLPAGVLSMIRSFQQRGGRVLVWGKEVPGVSGATTISEPLLSIWRGPGFRPETHAWLWEQFAALREPLSAALEKVKLTPRASVDPQRGYALTLDDGPLRYVVVIADRVGTHSSQFEREIALPIRLDGEGWTVRDLRTQTELAVNSTAGGTTVNVELATEPATLLLLHREPLPEFRAVELRPSESARGDLQLGDTLAWRGATIGTSGGATEDANGAAASFSSRPIRWTLWAPDNQPRGEWLRGQNEAVSVRLADHDRAGTWKLVGQELLAGVTLEHDMAVAAPAKRPLAASAIDDVHVVNADHLSQFVSADREPEKLILLEPGQESLRPIADRLAGKLRETGVAARVWMLAPEDFDTHPNRWFPRLEDETRQKKIDVGQLVGVRRQMQPFIDKAKAVHLPERGGYPSIAPDYLIGQDAIVFSGGRIAESLRIVTPWLPTPHVPGRGQGRIVIVFSPFVADRQVAALVANDVLGFEKAADRLASAFSAESVGSAKRPRTTTTLAQNERPLTPSKVTRLPVPRPLTMLAPHRRVESVLVNQRGAAALVMQDGAGTALIDSSGKLTAAVTSGINSQLDNDGHLWDFVADSNGSGGEKEWSLAMRRIGADGALQLIRPAFAGSLNVPGAKTGFAVSPNGKFAALARHGEILFGSPDENGWNAYSDAANAQERFAIFYPRLPTNMVFSPDGRFVCVSLDTRPPVNNMSGPLFQPTHAETMLLDLQTGERRWALRDRAPNRSTYATHRGYLAVAREANRVALADYDGNLFVVNEAGQPLFERRVVQVDRTQSSRLAPIGGVGVSISDDGLLAAFAFQNSLTLVAGAEAFDVPLENITAVGVARSGSLVLVATADAAIIALRKNGEIAWRKETNAAALRLAAGPSDQLFVGTGEGDLLVFDASGNEVRRGSYFDVAKSQVVMARETGDTRKLDEPRLYSPPDTLETARKKLAAKSLARWQPTGSPREASGLSFFVVNEPLRLAVPTAGDCSVHLVYRRPMENRSLTITTNSRDGQETFELDLPTPVYRAIDLPIRGPKVEVTLTGDGPVEIAEFSLWSLTWPGANLLLVHSAGDAGDQTATTVTKTAAGADDILGDLNRQATSSQVAGKAKTCRVWWPNTDPDRLKGRFLPSPADPLAIVDGRRFGNGQAKVWSPKASPWGASLTVEIGQAVPVSLVATYDRARKQSEVCQRQLVFSGLLKHEHDSPPPLAPAVLDNDQFWRLFAFPETKVETLGVHTFHEIRPIGLSEVEAYR